MHNSSLNFKNLFKTCNFKSFDGFSDSKVTVFSPDRYKFWDNYPIKTNVISRGAGLSYVSSSFMENGNTVLHKSFDRITGFDSKNSIIEVEAGITLHKLYKFMLSKKLYLPILPGYSNITIGGCVAADVHGKNHVKDGTFINQVESLELFHPKEGFINLSRNENENLFKLTCGGFGLTGHIIKIRLKAKKIPSHVVNYNAKFYLSLKNCFEDFSNFAMNYDFTHIWHDGLNSAILFYANFYKKNMIPNVPPIPKKYPKLNSLNRSIFSFSLFNKYTANILNLLYKYKNKEYEKGKLISLYNACFPAEKF